MLKDFIVKGLLFGVVVGLLTTLFDALTIVTSNGYIPASYPILLVSFNILFWTTTGFFSFVFVAVYTQKAKTAKKSKCILDASFAFAICPVLRNIRKVLY